MNALEFIEECKGKTEKELKKIIIQNVWHIEDVDEEIRRIEDTTPYHPCVSYLTKKEKLKILEDSIADYGDCSCDEIRERIQEEIFYYHSKKEQQAETEAL